MQAPQPHLGLRCTSHLLSGAQQGVKHCTPSPHPFLRLDCLSAGLQWQDTVGSAYIHTSFMSGSAIGHLLYQVRSAVRCPAELQALQAVQEVEPAWAAEADRLKAAGLLSLPEHEHARWRSTPAGIAAARARVAQLLAAAQPQLDAIHKQVHSPVCALAGSDLLYMQPRPASSGRTPYLAVCLKVRPDVSSGSLPDL